MSGRRVDGKSFDLARRTGLRIEAVYCLCGSLGVPEQELSELGYVRELVGRDVTARFDLFGWRKIVERASSLFRHSNGQFFTERHLRRVLTEHGLMICVAQVMVTHTNTLMSGVGAYVANRQAGITIRQQNLLQNRSRLLLTEIVKPGTPGRKRD